MVRLLSAVIALLLCGCSGLPAVAEQAAPASLAFEDASSTSSVTAVPVSARAIEGQQVSYRRASAPDVSPSPVLSVPSLPISVPIVDTEIAVMPEALASIDVFSVASEYSRVKITFGRFDEFNEPRVFRIVGESGDFFNVQVPMRPNGSTGYIRKSDVEVISTDQRVLIDLSERSVVVWDGDEIVLDTSGTIGQPSTPTPTGSFYVRNVFEWYADSIYGPYVIPLSAYSESIDQINGGDAVVAIHGTQRPDLVGAAASLGCIRLDNDTLRQLAAIIEPGAPVDIVE